MLVSTIEYCGDVRFLWVKMNSLFALGAFVMLLLFIAVLGGISARASNDLVSSHLDPVVVWKGIYFGVFPAVGIITGILLYCKDLGDNNTLEYGYWWIVRSFEVATPTRRDIAGTTV
ncbi:hypothetical protein F4808DRAFT_438586 [Astrocystis sublimbata]|nr:hypothetical protein F4808DRAFT_438586 [Astrocystis sublimbata]